MKGLRARATAANFPAEEERPRFSTAVARGAFTGILNPKEALFFLAFLPQFVRPDRGHAMLQFVVLGLLFSVLCFLGDTAMALAVGDFSGTLRRSPAWTVWGERAVGAVLVGLGLRLALQRRA